MLVHELSECFDISRGNGCHVHYVENHVLHGPYRLSASDRSVLEADKPKQGDGGTGS
jgi:hypothetical protein